MSEPKDGDLRVWWCPQVPCEPIHISVKSAKDGAMIMNVLAEYDAYQYLTRIKPDYCNAGCLQVFCEGEWIDWEDEMTFTDDPLERFPQPNIGWCAKLNEEMV